MKHSISFRDGKPCRHCMRWDEKGGLTRCEAPGVEVTGKPPANRRPVVECLCPDHGGKEEAVSRVKRYWSMCAPESVGDDSKVLTAGALCLTSRSTHIRVMEVVYGDSPTVYRIGWPKSLHALLEKELPPHTLKRMGWRGRSWTTRCPEETLELISSWTSRTVDWWKEGGIEITQATPPEHRVRWSYAIGVWGLTDVRGEAATKEEAIEKATDCWRRVLADRVDYITKARGGDLSWGLEIDPPDSPVCWCGPRVSAA